MGEAARTTALATLDSLELRLQRVEYYLSGSDNTEDILQQVAARGQDHTVQARLARLEQGLGKLSLRSHVVGDLLTLRESAFQWMFRAHSAKDAKYPDLFHATSSDVPTTLSVSELVAIINSCAPAFPTTASRLHAIRDMPIPSAESSAALIALHPGLIGVEMLQEAQAREMAELRIRSARAVQRWYELSVLGGSECWNEWECRVGEVEKRARREESHRAKEAEESVAYAS